MSGNKHRGKGRELRPCPGCELKEDLEAENKSLLELMRTIYPAIFTQAMLLEHAGEEQAALSAARIACRLRDIVGEAS
jgi:hypothetical protein